MTTSAMHNDIMEAGSKYRPPMLAPVVTLSGNPDPWIAIERLMQEESINKQDVKTNLLWEFGKFTSRDEETLESYYSRFYKMMNEMERNKLKVDTLQGEGPTPVSALIHAATMEIDFLSHGQLKKEAG
ncbi:hypothetical protein Tco_0971342 [Tanacetum coccineum]